MASLEKTSANSENSLGRTIEDFAFSTAAASSIAVVSLATIGDPRTKQKSSQMTLWRAWFHLAWAMN